jgi:hypothetical protein
MKFIKLFESYIDGKDVIRLSDLPKRPAFNQDLIRNIKDKKYKLKNTFDGFVSSAEAEGDEAKINRGIYPEDLARVILNCINLNHFQKNHPYVDLGVVKPIEGVTQQNEVISIKSTVNFKSIKNLIADTKSIKFETLFSYLVFAYNNFYSTKIQRSPKSILDGVLKDLILKKGYNFSKGGKDQTKTKGIIYIILGHLFTVSKNYSKDFYKNLYDDIDNYLKGDNKILDDEKKVVVNALSKINHPVSLGIVYFKPEKDIIPTVLHIEKTQGIPLNHFFMKVMDIWNKKGFFHPVGKSNTFVVKYLKYDDLQTIFAKTDPFEIKINVDFSDFKVSYKPNRVLRMQTATEIKDVYLDKNHEEEILQFVNKMIKQLSHNPEYIDEYIDFKDDLDSKENIIEDE